MAAGKPAGFTLDGPRGPARVAQPGAVWLAKATGNPVLPFHLEASRSLDAEQLGPDANPEAVRHRGDRDGRAVPGRRQMRMTDALERARLMLEERLKVLETRALQLLSPRT